jgi:hypothetical protein
LGVSLDDQLRANRRLVDLGYSRKDAHAEVEGHGLRVSGELVMETDVEHGSIGAVLEMMPPKLRLLAMRHVLRREARSS